MGERLRQWVLGRQQQLEEARDTSPTVGFAFDAFSYDTDTGAPVLAAALAFRVFLFQVPYVCVFVIGAGFVAVATLIQLMLARRDEILRALKADLKAEKQRQEEESRLAKQREGRKRKAA